MARISLEWVSIASIDLWDLLSSDPVSGMVNWVASVVGITAGTMGIVIALTGLLTLGLGFHLKHSKSGYIAAPGWALLGLFFFLDSGYYIALEDPVLVFMSAAALPLGLVLSVFEIRRAKSQDPDSAVVWFRGAVFWSALPYFIASHIPYVNASVVWFVAWNTVLFLRWTGAGEVHLAEMRVDVPGAPGGCDPALLAHCDPTWTGWEGNRWILTESLGEGGFYVPLQFVDGSSVDIGFVLGCSALQSMIIFVGALVAVRQAPWRRRIRALLVTLPVIHVLNVFRNSGIVWLHTTYPEWRWQGLNIFDFTHSYAAKFGSLFAMFLMALVLFELVPQLHAHVVRLLEPFWKPFAKRSPKPS